MKNTLSIKLNRDFKRLYYKGGCISSDIVVIYYKRTRNDYNRLGITVGTKIGGAVVRNRVKRLVRESYRLMEDELKRGYDFVIVARAKAASSNQKTVGGAMRRLFKEIKLLIENEKGDEN